MAIAEDIKKLGEDIVASYDSRVKATGTLVKDTHQMLKGFDAEHKEMSAKQAEALASFVADLTKNVGNMIKGFQKEHKEMADNLKEHADNLKESLEKGETNRLKDFKAMMARIQKEIKDIEAYVAKKLKEFSDAHAEMSEQQKQDLAKYVSGIANEVKKLLGEYGSDMEKAGAAWQGMVDTLSKARKKGKAVMPEVEAGGEVKTVKEAVEGVEKPKKKGRKKGKGKKRVD